MDMSPLTQGRELKQDKKCDKWDVWESPLTQGRELKRSTQKLYAPTRAGRPSRRGVN